MISTYRCVWCNSCSHQRKGCVVSEGVHHIWKILKKSVPIQKLCQLLQVRSVHPHNDWNDGSFLRVFGVESREGLTKVVVEIKNDEKLQKEYENLVSCETEHSALVDEVRAFFRNNMNDMLIG